MSDDYKKLTDKLTFRRIDGYGDYYTFYCPGCKEEHAYIVRDSSQRPAWSYNGNPEAPTFTPSLLYNRHKADYDGCGPRCHIYLTDGRIQFLGDCEHELAGQTVDMVPLPNGGDAC